MRKMYPEYKVFYSNTGEGTFYARTRDYGIAKQMVRELKEKINNAELTVSRIWIEEVKKHTIWEEQV